jgi:hypothetical protein
MMSRVRLDARLLNHSGKTTGHGNGWTEQRVRGFRKHYEIEVLRLLEAAPGPKHKAALSVAYGCPRSEDRNLHQLRLRFGRDEGGRP